MLLFEPSKLWLVILYINYLYKIIVNKKDKDEIVKLYKNLVKVFYLLIKIVDKFNQTSFLYK